LVNAKQRREFKLFDELQRKHGYTLLEPGRGVEKTMLMFDRKTKKMSVAVVMRLTFPAGSALGESVLKYRKSLKAPAKTANRKRS
jgi:hypothetical protein